MPLSQDQPDVVPRLMERVGRTRAAAVANDWRSAVPVERSGRILTAQLHDYTLSITTLSTTDPVVQPLADLPF